MTESLAQLKPRQRLILVVLVLCSLLFWLDNTVLSTTTETLADSVRGLGATPVELQWATGAYTLTFATLMFTAAALGDRFGHRTTLVIGLVLFGGSSTGVVPRSGADDQPACAGHVVGGR